MNRYEIQGTVLCKCGGILISEDGKGRYSQDMLLSCWKCNRKYDTEEVYSVRQPNKKVIYYDNYGRMEKEVE